MLGSNEKATIRKTVEEILVNFASGNDFHCGRLEINFSHDSRIIGRSISDSKVFCF